MSASDEGSVKQDDSVSTDPSSSTPETPKARRRRIRNERIRIRNERIAQERIRKRKEIARERKERIRQRTERIKCQQQFIYQRRRATKPQVHRVDLENFKNKYNWTPAYVEYAVEILVGPWDLSNQYREEKKQREPAEKTMTRPGKLVTYDFQGLVGEWGPNTKVDADSTRDQEKGTKVTQAVDSTDEYIHRIRVHSNPVLGYLTELMGDKFVRDIPWAPRTFMRPFMSLIVYHEHMRDFLAVLEQQWAAVEDNGDLATATQPLEEDNEKQMSRGKDGSGMDGQSTPLVPELLENASSGEAIVDISTPPEDNPATVKEDQVIDMNSGRQPEFDDDTASAYTASACTSSIYTDSLASIKYDNDENKTYMQETMYTVEALRDMRCYVDLIDHEIMPHYLALRGESETKVLFDDLGCLFHPGDIIYRQKADHGDKSRSGHELWRMYEVEVPGMEGRTSYDSDSDLRGGPSLDPSARDHRQGLILTCYSFDFDGTSYGAVHETFNIPYFPGWKSIRSLQVYPLRFVKDQDAVLAASRSTGEKYHGALAQRHQSYHNWTIPTQSGTFPEFIDSHVIVDFEETFRKEPYWRPNFHHPQKERDESESQFGWCYDTWDVYYHTGEREAAELYYLELEVLTFDCSIFKWQRQKFIENDSFLRTQTVENTYDEFDGPPIPVITGDDLALLPRRAYAYTLRERRFVSIDINHLRPITAQDDVLQRLKISSQYKDILRGLVSSHFQKKELERLYLSHSMEAISQDLISGKGKGLVSKL